MNGIPPEPPDPPDIMDTSNTESRKRPLANDTNADSIPKKTSVEPSASIQNSFTNPDFANKLKYNSNDPAPFLVHISRSEPDPSAGLSIRVLKFAQLLYKHKVKGIASGGIKSVGRNKVGVVFLSAEDANNFIDSSFITENKFLAIIPMYHVSRMGIIKQIPVDWSMEELVSALEYPCNCGPVIKARRLNRKTVNNGTTVWLPTQTVVITFYGQTLPSKVFCFHTAIPVDIYQLPTIQCLNCCRFGHVKSQCRSNPRCYRCAQPHTGDSCSISEAISTCLFCSSNHFSTNRNCPEHSRQKSIKIVMSQDNIPYTEASQRFPPVRRTYADVASTLFAPSQPLTNSLNSPNKDLSSQTSHRKTVTIQRRPRSILGQSFDKETHNFLTSTPSSSQPNGCALSNHNECSSNENLLELLLATVVNIISKFNDSLPNNVTTKLQELISAVNNGPNKFPSVEQ